MRPLQLFAVPLALALMLIDVQAFAAVVDQRSSDVAVVSSLPSSPAAAFDTATMSGAATQSMLESNARTLLAREDAATITDGATVARSFDATASSDHVVARPATAVVATLALMLFFFIRRLT